MKSLAPRLLFLAALPGAAQNMHHGSMHPLAAPDPNERLGTVSFPVSCAPSSQPPFNRGVALLHDFWYDEARAQFNRLAAADPACAMAHWGIAMSGFHQIWDRPNDDAMKTGWAEMRKAQAHPPSTGREKGYIAALADFFHPGAKEYPVRIANYAAAMGSLYAQNPQDVDAGALYALSLLAAEMPDDTSLSQRHKAMAVLTPLFAKFPDNPGVVHYIVHACDNPAMAPDGLAAADHYGEIAQSGPHAFHMPGHIYARLGLWPRDIADQLGSIAASEAADARGESGIMDELHSYDFLLYACIQSGRDSCARSALDRSAAVLTRLASMPGMGSGYMEGMVPYYRVELTAFYDLEIRDWKSAAALERVTGAPPEVSTLVYWARALGHGRLRQREEAEADLAHYDELIAEIRKGKRPYVADGTGPKIERGEMRAWAAFAAGDEAEALKAMRAAADLQDKVGQGEVDIPAREMLADMLLEFGHPRQALDEYDVALKLSPNRLNGLYNAGRAAELAGDAPRAGSYYSALLKSTAGGVNSGRPESPTPGAFPAASRPAINSSWNLYCSLDRLTGLTLLELQDIQKHFGGVSALRSGNLSVNAGEVHLLLGENGAGKSTLMKIVAGIVQRDSGRMLWNGQEVFLRTPAEAAAIGIAMVHQESLLAPHMSVAENIFLGREDRGAMGWLNRGIIIERARHIIGQYDFPLDPEARVDRLSPAGRQLVEICRAVQHGSSLLIFDEPTSSLSDAETQQVFRIVRDLKARRMGIIYITHRMDELRAIGDRVTVLRDGSTVHTGPLAEIATPQLIQHMVGREVTAIYERPHLTPGEPMLELRNVSVVRSRLRNISLTLRRGEITGMAGLMGAGRTELCRAIFGVDPIDGGEILIRDKPVRIRHPREAVKQGIALVTEDRQVSGLALRMPIAANVTMANLERVSRFGFLDRKAQNRLCGELASRLRLKAASTAQRAETLSGGNQQKVVIAKWLFRDASIFLFDEPTRGIDIGAKVEVFELMSELARAGAAILMVSSELPELLHVADRIVVMRQGRISGELPRNTTQEQIMRQAVMDSAA